MREERERERRRGEGVEEERKIAEEEEGKRKEGQGGEVGDGGGEGTLHLLHCIILQISEVSDIPVERVEFAKVCGKRCAHLCSPTWLTRVATSHVPRVMDHFRVRCQSWRWRMNWSGTPASPQSAPCPSPSTMMELSFTTSEMMSLCVRLKCLSHLLLLCLRLAASAGLPDKFSTHEIFNKLVTCFNLDR